MPYLIGKPLDRLTRALLTTPPSPSPAILRDEVSLVIPLIEGMGQTYQSAQGVAAAPAAGALLAQITTVADGFYDLTFNAFVAAPVAGLAAVRRLEYRIVDETGIQVTNFFAFLLAGVNVPFYHRAFLRNGWKVQIQTIDAFAVGETIDSALTATLRYQ